jgi:hypothetical protein
VVVNNPAAATLVVNNPAAATLIVNNPVVATVVVNHLAVARNVLFASQCVAVHVPTNFYSIRSILKQQGELEIITYK